MQGCPSERRIFPNKEAFQRHLRRFHVTIGLSDAGFSAPDIYSGDNGLERHCPRYTSPQYVINNAKFIPENMEEDRRENIDDTEHHKVLVGKFMTGLNHLHVS
jgi:hypothetical protein